MNFYVYPGKLRRSCSAFFEGVFKSLHHYRVPVTVLKATKPNENEDAPHSQSAVWKSLGTLSYVPGKALTSLSTENHHPCRLVQNLGPSHVFDMPLFTYTFLLASFGF